MKRLIEEVILGYNRWLNGETNFTIGLSGGVDSVVLLNIFGKLRHELPIKVNAVHVNHGISPNAGDWEAFCITICDNLAIPIDTYRHNIRRLGGESLENNAREVRYQEFQRYTNSVIVLAHHKNDQVETMLSQLLRGSDVHNISAMSYISKKNQQRYWRPLLNVSREDIEWFANQYQLEYVNDESNQDIKYLRNFIRHRLLPEITAWDKNGLNKLAGVVDQMQEVSGLLDEIAIGDYNLVGSGDSELVIFVDKFRQLSRLRQANLLCYFIHLHGIRLPARSRIFEFCRQVSVAGVDKHPSLKLFNNWVIIRARNTILVQK